jgi:hypothetical protein
VELLNCDDGAWKGRSYLCSGVALEDIFAHILDGAEAAAHLPNEEEV